MMRILVCGDRNWTDIGVIARVLEKYPPGTVLIHGAARGADTIAGDLGRYFEFEIMEFPVDWNKARTELVENWRRAGPMRNQRMLDEGKPDLVIAFHPDLEKSKGTRDMVRRARKAGVKTIVYDRNGTLLDNV